MRGRWLFRSTTLRVEPELLHDEELWADVELPPKQVRAKAKLWLEFGAFVIVGTAVAASSLIAGVRVRWDLTRPLLEGRDTPAWLVMTLVVLMGLGIIALGAFGLIRALSYRAVAVAEREARAVAVAEREARAREEERLRGDGVAPEP